MLISNEVQRDRRLHEGEFEKILEVIRGGVLKRRFRPYHIEDAQAVEDLFILALETAMRMSEIYTLGKNQVMVGKATVSLTKTKNGDKRQVPLSSVAVPIIERRVGECKGTELFPWWDENKDRKEVTSFLSKLYASIFKDAGCPDLRFHDLRHEATSRLFERTTLRGEEIMRITGHRSHAMLMRYMNLRASEHASSLW